MTDRELLQQALDALEAWDARGRLRVIEAIRTRLAQPEPNIQWVELSDNDAEELKAAIEKEGRKPNATLTNEGTMPEPVAWAKLTNGLLLDFILPEEHESYEGEYTIPLYTAPPKKEWVGLTDDERYLNDGRSEEEIEYAKSIEAKLKEKNNG